MYAGLTPAKIGALSVILGKDIDFSHSGKAERPGRQLFFRKGNFVEKLQPVDRLNLHKNPIRLSCALILANGEGLTAF